MRMLIVEDDADGREILVELFRRHDWRVVAVATTDAALTELRNRRFDLVISDENLAGASGSEMLRTACGEGLLSKVTALMYTSEAAWLEVPRGVRVLHKPLTIGSLVDEVTRAVEAAALEAVPSSRSPTSKASARAQPAPTPD